MYLKRYFEKSAVSCSVSECSYLISDFVDSSAIEGDSVIVKKTDDFDEGGAQHGGEQGLRHVQRRLRERRLLLIC